MFIGDDFNELDDDEENFDNYQMNSFSDNEEQWLNNDSEQFAEDDNQSTDVDNYYDNKTLEEYHSKSSLFKNSTEKKSNKHKTTQGFNGSISDFKKTKPIFSKEEFLKKPVNFQISSILSDGQWYTSEKLSKIIKNNNLDEVKEVLKNLLKNNKIIESDSKESYRMSFSQLQQWRESNNIPLQAQIIDNILYPRLISVDGTMITEQEAFLSVKRHHFGSVKFTLSSPDSIDFIKQRLWHVGKFINSDYPKERWTIICLSADWVKKQLEKVEQEYNSSHTIKLFAENGKPSLYNVGFMRDLNEMRKSVVTQIVRFYLSFQAASANGELRPAILQSSSYKTLKLYLDDSGTQPGLINSNVMTQVNAWIIDAIQHFDEQCNSPFAAYLTMLTNARANDIPKNVLGSALAKFQNLKFKTIKELNKKNGNNASAWYDNDTIFNAMREQFPEYQITKEQFDIFSEDFKNWQIQQHNVTSELQWSETGAEKRFNSNSYTGEDKQISTEVQVKKNDEASIIQHSIIKAAINSKKPEDGKMLLLALSKNISLENMIKTIKVSNVFKTTLATILANGMSTVR